jgi:hypothetical protein
MCLDLLVHSISHILPYFNYYYQFHVVESCMCATQVVIIVGSWITFFAGVKAILKALYASDCHIL